MAKITFTLEGDLDELIPVLSKFGDIKSIKAINKDIKTNSSEEWTRERALLVWNDLSENAKTVLGVIARNDEKSWEEQLNIIGQTANEVGGSLSSLGARLKNHGLKGITRPIFDNKASGFGILPIWKEVAIENTQEL